MTRFPDWQTRLAAFIDARREMPFAWGANDCCTFAAHAVEAITGEPVMEALSSPYSDRREALRELRKFGGMRRLVTRVLGAPRSPLLALPGDVGLLESGALAVCNGSVWVAPSAVGLSARPLGDAVRSWKVG